MKTHEILGVKMCCHSVYTQDIEIKYLKQLNTSVVNLNNSRQNAYIGYFHNPPIFTV